MKRITAIDVYHTIETLKEIRQDTKRAVGLLEAKYPNNHYPRKILNEEISKLTEKIDEALSYAFDDSSREGFLDRYSNQGDQPDHKEEN